MKSINPATNEIWKSGDLTEDGRVFHCFRKRAQTDGYFQKQFYTPKQRQAILKESSRRKGIRRGEIRQRVADIKLQTGCKVCGYDEHACALDFDHRDLSQKKMSISDMVSRVVRREALDAEIAKCDILCANCHRVKTHGE